jgi:hypothetical protein
MEPKLITEPVADAYAEISDYRSGDLTGSEAFVRDVNETEQSEELKARLNRIKGTFVLGMFQNAHNRMEHRELVYARRNSAGMERADYTVLDGSRQWERDLEIAAIFERWEDFPKWTDPADASVQHVELSEPGRPLEDLQREVRKVHLVGCLAHHRW